MVKKQPSPTTSSSSIYLLHEKASQTMKQFEEFLIAQISWGHKDGGL